MENTQKKSANSTLAVEVEVVSNVPAVSTVPADKLASLWLDFTRKHSAVKSERSLSTYANAIGKYLDYAHDNGFDVLNATDDDVFKYREHLKKTKASSTTQLYFSSVSLFYRFLKAAGYIAANPAENMSAGVTINREHKRDYLSRNKAKELLSAMPSSTAKEKRDKAIVALMMTTGLRGCEVASAQCGDLKTVGDCPVLFIKGKGRSEKDSYVKIAPAVFDLIQDYLKLRFETQHMRDCDALFVSTSRNHRADVDEQLSTVSIRAIVKSAMKRIGFDDDRHSAHSLRHTAATLGLRAGKDITQVQQMMRHATIATSMIYAHSIEREKNDTELAIADSIFGD